MNQPLQLRPGPMYQGTKPVRDETYKRFIRRLPCVTCLRTWRVEACHTGPHATSQKSSDLDCIPLCWRCHPEFDKCQWRFAERHHLDILALIRRFNKFYQTKLGGKAA